ncbi:MAG: multi-sensor hybrid histidine kinase [Acidobacteria bacterium]|nr:multi-sensor hybrid histidine kinase [Acidobacteriota bacterium]
MPLFAPPPRRFAQLSLAVAAVYLSVAGAYIVISDRLLAALAGPDPRLVLSLQTLKGLVFVIATAVVLFVLLWQLSLASWRAARAEAEQRTRALESEVLLRHGPDAVLVLTDGACVAANRAAGELLGCPAEQLVGRRPDEFTAGGDEAAGQVERLAAAARDGAASRHGWRFRRPDGREGDAEVTLAALPGEPRRVVAWVRDVSEQREAQRLLREANEQLRLLVEGTPHFFFYVTDLAGKVTYVSPSVGAITGRSAEAWLADGAALFADTPGDPEVQAIIRRHRRDEFTGQPFQIEVRHAAGRPVRLEVFEHGVYRDGALAAVQGIAHDVTERTDAELLRDVSFRLSEAAAVARSAAELYPVIHAIVGELMPAANFYIALHDPVADRISFPYFVDEQDPVPVPKAPGRGLTEVVLRTGEPLLASPAVFEALVARGEVDLIGAPSIDWLGVPLKAHGRTTGVLVVQTYTEGVRYGERERDLLMLVSAHVAQVIERTRAQAQLRETEQRLRDIVEHSSNLFYAHGPDHVLTYVSPQTRQFVDCEPEEALVSWTEFATDNPVNRAGFESTQRAIRTGEAQPVFELELVGRAGRRIWVEVNEAPVVRDGRVVAVVGALTDITARRQAEAERSRLATAIEQAGESVILTDPEGVIEYVNPAFCRTSGFSRAEVLGAQLRSFEGVGVRPGQQQEMFDTLRRGVVWSGRSFKRRRDGTLYQVESSVAPVFDVGGETVQFVVVERDVTQEVELEAQLRQAQKVEAVGKLAGGLAHDFNNLLQALLSTVQVVQGNAGSPERVRALAGELEAHVRRGASLTRQLLIFARRDITRLEAVDLNDVVRDASELLRRLVRENIRMTGTLHPVPLLVEADRGQLEQVLVNLVLNASEAMPGGGDLTLQTGQDRDGGAWFEVHDTGVGMAEEVRSRIFEPFFTTKAGKGTGLGLSVVNNIVGRHGGTVSVTTDEGRGSSFRVTLPARPLGLPSEALWPAASQQPPAGRGERVLLVEDESGAREGLADVLSMLGYAVTAVESGERAEAIAGDVPFDVLLTDLMLPGVSGAELAGRLAGRWPALRVLVMSGYAEEDALRRGSQLGTLRYLQKPFDMNTLARELRAALDGEAPGPAEPAP